MMAKKVKRKVSQVVNPAAVPGVLETQPTNGGPANGSHEAPAVRSSYRSRANAPYEFNPDYSYVMKDLKRIGTLAGTFFIILIVLSFIIR
jgi:hypothetical protein